MIRGSTIALFDRRLPGLRTRPIRRSVRASNRSSPLRNLPRPSRSRRTCPVRHGMHGTIAALGDVVRVTGDAAWGEMRHATRYLQRRIEEIKCTVTVIRNSRLSVWERWRVSAAVFTVHSVPITLFGHSCLVLIAGKRPTIITSDSIHRLQ